MPDIVERLRAHFNGLEDKGVRSSTFGIVLEAADEIVRLRAALYDEKRWSASLECSAQAFAEQASSLARALKERP